MVGTDFHKILWGRHNNLPLSSRTPNCLAYFLQQNQLLNYMYRWQHIGNKKYLLSRISRMTLQELSPNDFIHLYPTIEWEPHCLQNSTPLQAPGEFCLRNLVPVDLPPCNWIMVLKQDVYMR